MKIANAKSQSLDNYQARYTNSAFSEDTHIENDGETLRMILGGVEFSGNDFDSLSPAKELTPDQLKHYPLDDQWLCLCTIECQVPVLIISPSSETNGIIDFKLTLGDPSSNGLVDCKLHVDIIFGGKVFSGPGESGWFEDELLEIQKQLPDGVFFQSCINCAYSDYSPYGHGLFGSMMCFRNMKEQYLRVDSKDEFWAIHDHYERKVQETYCCKEFDRRTGAGYRG